MTVAAVEPVHTFIGLHDAALHARLKYCALSVRLTIELLPERVCGSTRTELM
jgi:hypothetical protein